MTFGSLILFVFIAYLLTIVGKTVLANYQSNKDIDKEADKLTVMEDEIKSLQDQINYYQTSSYKEEEARAKLGYKAPGENVLVLPIDTIEEKKPDGSVAPAQVKIPNYSLWWKYFFGE